MQKTELRNVTLPICEGWTRHVRIVKIYNRDNDETNYEVETTDTGRIQETKEILVPTLEKAEAIFLRQSSFVFQNRSRKDTGGVKFFP